MGGRRATRGLGVAGGLGVIAVFSAVLSAVGFAVVSPPAQSTPEYSSQFNQRYNTRGTKLEGCQTCHTDPNGGAENINPYGADFGKNSHDFGAIEPLDSDGDGVSNINEIKAGSFPGDPKDKPK